MTYVWKRKRIYSSVAWHDVCVEAQKNLQRSMAYVWMWMKCKRAYRYVGAHMCGSVNDVTIPPHPTFHSRMQKMTTVASVSDARHHKHIINYSLYTYIVYMHLNGPPGNCGIVALEDGLEICWVSRLWFQGWTSGSFLSPNRIYNMRLDELSHFPEMWGQTIREVHSWFLAKEKRHNLIMKKTLCVRFIQTNKNTYIHIYIPTYIDT